MAKYLLLWEMDMSRLPVDPQERLAGEIKLLTMIKGDLESGRLKDWGVFPGGNAGYAIMEGTDQDVLLGAEKYTPYAKFKASTVLSIDQAWATHNTAKAQFAAAKK